MNPLLVRISNILNRLFLCCFEDEEVQYFGVPFILSPAWHRVAILFVMDHMTCIERVIVEKHVDIKLITPRELRQRTMILGSTVVFRCCEKSRDLIEN